MGLMDKFLGYMKLGDDEDDGYYDDDKKYEEYDYDDEEYEEYDDEEYYDEYDDYDEVPVEKKPKIKSIQKADSYEEEERPRKALQKVTPMRPAPRRSGVPGMNVQVIKPTSVEDAREITETLLENRTVVLNMEGLDIDIAQRIIDFTSGACYSLGGSLQKVSSYIFVLGPYNVDITGDLQNILGGSAPSVRAGY